MQRKAGSWRLTCDGRFTGATKNEPGTATSKKEGCEMAESTDETPPLAKVADVSDKLADKPKLPRHGLSPTAITVAATGIGSAALVAALLYANRSRKPKNPGSV